MRGHVAILATRAKARDYIWNQRSALKCMGVIVKAEKQGRERVYRIVRERLDVARLWFNWLEH